MASVADTFVTQVPTLSFSKMVGKDLVNKMKFFTIGNILREFTLAAEPKGKLFRAHSGTWVMHSGRVTIVTFVLLAYKEFFGAVDLISFLSASSLKRKMYGDSQDRLS